jgi:hypothetical protein
MSNTRNGLLVKIITALGGTVRNPENRNMLLEDWRDAVGGGQPATRFAPNFNGISQYAKPSDIVVSGDYSMEFKLKSNVGLGNDIAVYIGNDTSTSLSIASNGGGNFRFRTPRGGSINGAPFPPNLAGSTDTHTVTVSFVGNDYEFRFDGQLVGSGTTVNTNDFTINAFGTYDTSLNFFLSGMIYNFSDSNGNNYPMDDGWANNPTMRNAGTGADGTFINMTEAAWLEIQQ